MTDVVYRRSPAAIWRSSSTLLVAAVPPHPPTRMSGSAGLVWQRLAQPTTIDAIVAALAAETGGPADTIRADVESLLEALRPLGLVEVVT